ncbi:MAG: hypothetical protein GF393_00575 [Armatimonadia bacterium]|nr:hypothetical protein [Armatimonadia bacterium]
MMATPHLLVGAAAGRILHRRPWAAISVAFASHLVLDATPHLDSNDLYGSATGWTGPEVSIAVTDFLLGCAVSLIVSRGQLWRRTALWAAFSAIVLDLVNTIPPVGPWFVAWPGTAWLDRFHHGIQPDVSPDNLLLGFGTQAAVIAVGLWVLLRRRAIRLTTWDLSGRDVPPARRPRSDR